jgi:hypothetical protein
MMKRRKLIIFALLVYALFSFACAYIVLPEGLEEPEAAGMKVGAWRGIVTNVTQAAGGGLHIDLAIRNDTGDWAAMHAVEGQPAVLTSSGKESSCATVFVGTGGHRLAPGFQMRGYTSSAQQVQTLSVECVGASEAAGATLRIPFVSFGGILDEYDTEANRTEGELELSLDDVAGELTYPVASKVDGLILPKSTPLIALSDNVVTLVGVERTASGFVLTWKNDNPTKFPLKTHIGIPPVIGVDGILYGVYDTLDLAPVPITPAKGSMEWTTEVQVPADGTQGFFILLSVESKKPRTYLNYVLDITEP